MNSKSRNNSIITTDDRCCLSVLLNKQTRDGGEGGGWIILHTPHSLPGSAAAVNINLDVNKCLRNIEYENTEKGVGL